MFHQIKMQAGFKNENNPQSLLWLCLADLAFILLKGACLAPSAELLILSTAVLQGSISESAWAAREAGYFYAGVLTKDSYFCMYAQT